MNRLLSCVLAWLLALAVLTAHGQTPSDDEQTLRSAGLATDGPALLAVIRKHTLTPQAREQVRSLIANLGEERFAVRENASKELFSLGRITLPQLVEASKHKDLEVARRAKRLIESIESEPAHHLPLAVIRLLAVRKPIGTIETLLAYVPHAEDEMRIEEVRKALTTLALHDGKPDTTLVHALSDTQPSLRVMAAQALAEGGGIEGRSAVRELLKDDSPFIRCRAALALALAKERDAVPVLIDLLAVLPADQVGEVESVLYQLAGDSAPKTPVGTEPDEKKKCRAAWAAWWRGNAQRVDLTRLSVPPQLGFTLICDTRKNRLYEIDRHGKERWAINNVQGPVDAVVLPNNRVLVAEYHANRVTERDFKGNILWQTPVPSPVSVQRLPSGNTFIATDQGQMREVDRTGKEIYTIQKVPGNPRVAYRLRHGLIVCLTNTGECVLIDTTGKRIKGFATHQVPEDVAGIDLTPNGRILVAQHRRGKVVEYDTEGKKILELDAPRAATATSMPNGHILAASYDTHRVFELDRAGKVVWEHKDAGHAWRARRR